MRWQELTQPQFSRAVDEVGGVCVIPLGVVETHAGHLPLGTDYLVVEEVAARAAQIEPAIVFPPYYFGVFGGGMHQPGTIEYDYRLMFELLIEVCDEIARNGLKKIILLNGHGGNNGFVQDFLATMLERSRDYAVYLQSFGDWYGVNNLEWMKRKTSQGGGHACETETSFVYGTHPELVRMEEHCGSGTPQKRFTLTAGVHTPVQGFANNPDHYVGDGRPATREKGEWLVNHAVQKVAEQIRVVKADTKTAEYLRKFYKEAAHPK